MLSDLRHLPHPVSRRSLDAAASCPRDSAHVATPEQWPTQVVFDYFRRRKRKPQTERDEAVETSCLRRMLDIAATKNERRKTNGGEETGSDKTSGEDVGNVKTSDIETSGENTIGEEAGSEITRGEQLDLGFCGGKTERFSLRSLRRERVGKFDRKPKTDADAIAADTFAPPVVPHVRRHRLRLRRERAGREFVRRFEPRVEQLAMAEAVGAFAASDNLMVEAGTTGLENPWRTWFPPPGAHEQYIRRYSDEDERLA